MYAKRACPAGDPCDVLGLLHGPHRVDARLVMILLSQQRWTSTQIAGLLGCDPRTVRRWVHRYNTEGTAGLADLPPAGPTTPGQPQARRSSPPAAHPTQSLDGRRRHQARARRAHYQRRERKVG